MDWQVVTIHKVLDEHLGDMASVLPDGIVVQPALCFVDAIWSLLTRRPFLVRDVAICWPKSLPELLTRPGPVDQETIHRVAGTLAAALPSA